MVKTFEWRDDHLVPAGDAVDMAGASAHLPAGAYTTLRTYGGRRFLRVDDHTGRLARSAGEPLEPARLRAALRAALGATGHSESRLRVTYAPPRLLLSVEPFPPPPESLYREGVRCATVDLRRQRPQAKDTRFIAAADAAYRRLPPGAHEGLLLADDGSILEGLSSNFFAVREGVLRTEGERALPGITRSLLLDVAVGLLPVQPSAVRVDELPAVSECFITSASRGVLPVVAVDTHTIGDGRPGPLTTELRRRLEDRIAAEAEEA
jgi:branched-chain amino acid aminotransferase